MTTAASLTGRGMVVRRVPVSSLTIDPSNARKHNPKNLDAVAASMGRWGQVEPLVVQKSTGKVIGGNGRLEVLRAQGATEVDINEVDLSDEEATALGIALNRSAELAEWDDETLSRLLATLPADLKGVTGFDAGDIVELLDRLSTGVVDEDEVPETPKVAVSRRGDLWALGNHRLLNGDSTNHDDVTRLMNGERAMLFATDPPYLVGYDGTNHPGTVVSRTRSSLNKDHSDTYGKSWDDADANSDLYDKFVAAAIACAIDERAAWYCWHASKRQAMLEAVWEKNGAFVHQQIVWAKTRPVLTRSSLLWAHEPCFLGWIKGNKPALYQREGDYVTTVWNIPSAEIEKVDHATSKPVRCFSIPMDLHTKRGELCFEPFSGSGSQIIAAEQTGRRCNAIEIEPRYVDVAILRWQKLTGKAATLDGRSYADVATERMGGPEGAPEPAAQPGPTSAAEPKRKTPRKAGSGAKEAAGV